MLSGGCIAVRLKSSPAAGCSPATPGRRSRPNFTNSSSHSDSSQDSRLLPTPTPISTPPSQPWSVVMLKAPYDDGRYLPLALSTHIIKAGFHSREVVGGLQLRLRLREESRLCLWIRLRVICPGDSGSEQRVGTASSGSLSSLGSRSYKCDRSITFF